MGIWTGGVLIDRMTILAKTENPKGGGGCNKPPSPRPDREG